MRHTISKRKLDQYISTTEKMLKEIEEYCTQADDQYQIMFDSLNTKQGSLENYAYYSAALYNTMNIVEDLKYHLEDVKMAKEFE